MNDKSKGFTVIELLVVISITIILGIIFTNILIDTLNGRNKVKAINQVKQNGQVVLDQLSNEIRNADGVVCVDKYLAAGANPETANDTIVITNGGIYTQFRFISPRPDDINPNENGKIQKLNFTKDNIPTGVSDSQLCIDQSPGINSPQFLTDSDPKNGVSIKYPPLDSRVPSKQNVFEQNGDNIMIRFNISAGVSAGYAYDVTVAAGGVPFSTSVQVRGIRK